MERKPDLESIRRTVYYRRKYSRIIEAVVTNNVGYLDRPQEGKEVNDKYLLDFKLYLSDMEGRKVLPNWDKGEKRLPLIAKMDVYWLDVVQG